MKSFELDRTEVAVLRTAVQQFSVGLAALKSSESSIQTNDSAAQTALSGQLDSLVNRAAVYLLQSVRPATAERLRVPARIVGQALVKSGGRW